MQSVSPGWTKNEPVRRFSRLCSALLLLCLWCLAPASADDATGSASLGDRAVVLHSIESAQTFAGRTAPAGLEFLTVRFFVLPTAAETIPQQDIGKLTLLEDADGFAYPPEQSPPEQGDSFLEPRDLKPGEGTFGGLVFLVPANSRESLVLVTKTSAGDLRLPLISAPVAPADPGKVVAGPAALGDLQVTVLKVERPAPEVASGQAGFDSVAVTLRFSNLSTQQGYQVHVTDLLLLREDDRFLHKPEDASGGPLDSDQVLAPGASLEGRVTFALHPDASRLELLTFASGGWIFLDMTPEIPPVAVVPLSGPLDAAQLTASLNGWRKAPEIAAPSGQASYVAEVAITYRNEDPAYSVDLPLDYLSLVDGAGQRYAPQRTAFSARAFGQTATLWGGLPTAGEVLFHLPDPPLGNLVLEVAGSDPTLRLPIAGESATEPPAEATLFLEGGSVHVGQPLRIGFSGMPGFEQDWIAVPLAGAPVEDDGGRWTYLKGRKSGVVEFPPLPAGDYEARAFFNWPDGGYVVQASLPFTVLPPISYGEWRKDHAENVLAYPHLASVTGDTRSWSRLFDRIIDSAEAKSLASTPANSPFIVTLEQPAPLTLVRLRLPDKDNQQFSLKLEASADAQSWQEVASWAAVQGWISVPLPGDPVGYLRLSGQGLSGGDGSLLIAELEAYVAQAESEPLPTGEPPPWQDALALSPVNVLRDVFGGQVSANWGHLTNNGVIGTPGDWGQIALANPMMIQLTQPYRVEILRLHILAGFDYRLLIEGSSDGQQWEHLADPSVGAEVGLLEVPLDGKSLQAIRITAQSQSAGSEGLRLEEIEVLSLGPFPYNAIAQIDRPGNFSGPGNVALALSGGSVVDASSWLDGDHEPTGAIDGALWPSAWVASREDVDPYLILRLSGNETPTIQAVRLHKSLSDTSRLIDLAYADESGDWQRIGRFVLNRPPLNDLIEFAPVSARFLRITVLDTYYENTPASFDEIAVLEAPGAASVLDYRDPAFQGGVNVALEGLGGAVLEADRLTEDGDFVAEKLINGMVIDWGWYSPDDVLPASFLFDLAGDQDQLIAGVSFYPDGGTNANRGPEDWSRLVEVSVAQAASPSIFQSIGVFQLDQDRRFQTFAFPATKASYVRLRILSSFGGWRTSLGEFEVLALPDPGAQAFNLLDWRVGGHMAIPLGINRDLAIDGTTQTPGWFSEEMAPPATLTLAFKNEQQARLSQVAINPKNGAPVENWARRVRVLVSDYPNRDFQPVGDLVLEPEDRMQSLTFAPVKARYIQLRILENGGGDYFSLGEIAAYELLEAGESSILARSPDDPALVFEVPATLAGTPPDPAEKEPNDRLLDATSLPLDSALYGIIQPLTDRDFYAIDSSPAIGDALTLRLAEEPRLTSTLKLFDESGGLVGEEELFDKGQAASVSTWAVPPGRYHVELSRPLNSIVIMGDQSGSTDPVRGDIAAAATAFVSTVRPDEAISVVGFCGSYNEYSDFSSDPVALAAASANLIYGCNGTALYAAMQQALDRLEERKGAKAIIIVTDAEDSGSHGQPLYDLWARVLESKVRIYGVGYGAAIHYRLDGFTGGDLLRALANATGGRYYDAPAGNDMAKVYAQVAADLRGGGIYSLAASVAPGLGRLSIAAGAEPITGVAAPRQIELILDASGSMEKELPGGGTRAKAAREVLGRLIDNLPDGTAVALRVYGHRKKSKPKSESCLDTELVVPFGPLDRAAMKDIIGSIRMRGQTPIGYSLAQVAEDFGGTPGAKVVVVVTDGIETCNDDPADPFFPATVAADLRKAGFDVRVNVVGFAIGNAETDAFLAEIAKAGGGTYFGADDGDSLSAAIAAAMQATFRIEDASGKVIATGRVGGESLELPAGFYNVVLETDPERRLPQVEVRYQEETRLTLTREGERFDVLSETAPIPSP